MTEAECRQVIAWGVTDKQLLQLRGGNSAIKQHKAKRAILTRFGLALLPISLASSRLCANVVTYEEECMTYAHSRELPQRR